MPSGAAARDAQPVGIDAVVRSVSTDVPDRPMDIQDDLRKRKLRLAAVNHLKDSLPFAGKDSRQPGIDAVVVGNPATTDHPDDADTVWMLRLEHIHGKRDAHFVAIDHVHNVVFVPGLGGGGTGK